MHRKAVTAAAALTGSDQEIANAWFRTLSPRERIAQLIMIGFNGRAWNYRSREYRKFLKLVSQEHAGGLILDRKSVV